VQAAREPVALRRCVVIIPLTIAISCLLAIDFGAQPAFVFLEVITRVLLIGSAACAWALVATRSAREAVIDDRPAPWVLASLIVSAGVLVLVSLVDVALFENIPLLLVALAIGSCLGVRCHATPRAARGTAAVMVPAVPMALAWVAGFALLVIPVALAQRHAAAGDRAAGSARGAVFASADRALRDAAGRFVRAWEWSPVSNADYAHRAAMCLTAIDDPGAAEWLDRAVEAAPRSPAYRLARARHRARGGEADRAAEDFAAAVHLNPQDVLGRIEFADHLESTGRRAEAAIQLGLALRTNDAYDPAEPERLSESQVQHLRDRVLRLQGSARVSMRR
jgi:hypothetical protein